MTPEEQTISEILSLSDDKAKIAMIQLYAKQQAVNYCHWVLKKMLMVDGTEPPDSAYDLYNQFLTQTIQ